MPPEPKQPIFDRATLIPFGLVAGAIVLTATCTSIVVTKMTNIESNLVRLAEAIDRASVDRWTGSHMSTWAALLKAQNPAITVPEPLDVRR